MLTSKVVQVSSHKYGHSFVPLASYTVPQLSNNTSPKECLKPRGSIHNAIHNAHRHHRLHSRQQARSTFFFFLNIQSTKQKKKEIDKKCFYKMLTHAVYLVLIITEQI